MGRWEDENHNSHPLNFSIFRFLRDLSVFAVIIKTLYFASPDCSGFAFVVMFFIKPLRKKPLLKAKYLYNMPNNLSQAKNIKEIKITIALFHFCLVK